MTKKEKQTYLDKHKVAVCCCQVCASPIYWWCGYRSIKHIFECKYFKPKEEENDNIRTINNL